MADPVENRRTWILAFCLALVTWSVFFGTYRNDFINFDDQEYVTQNPAVRSGFSAGGVIWAFTQAHSSNWHPVTWLSHMLDCELFGLNASAHHLVNAGWHTVNSLLLFLWLQWLTRSPWRSVTVAALFALHPLHVESVAWVAERKDLLCAFFSLLTLWFYCAYARIPHVSLGSCSPSRPRRRRQVCFALAICCFALALMSKAMAVTLPLVLLLLDYWPLNRLPPRTGREPWWLIREKLPFILMTLAICVVTLFTQNQAMEYSRKLSFAARAANAVVSYVRYLGKSFWPDNLAVIYPHPGYWPALVVLGSGLILAGISWFAVGNARQKPYLLFGWCWFIGMLLPVIGLVQAGSQAMADRYTYLPLVGLLLALVWAAADWAATSSGRNRLMAGVAVGALILCTIRTHTQIATWQNTETVFRHALAVTSGNWVAHFNLADLAMQRHQLTRQALTAPISPGKTAPQARDDLGEVLRHCRAGLEIHPTLTGPRILLAKALLERGDLDQAWEQTSLVLSLSPTKADAHQIRGDLLLGRGEIKPAIAAYRHALNLKPDWAEVLNNLAWILATHPDESMRDGAAALDFAQRASQLTGNTNFWFQQTLAAACAEKADFARAVSIAVQAGELVRHLGQPWLSELASNRANFYLAKKSYRDASLKRPSPERPVENNQEQTP